MSLMQSIDDRSAVVGIFGLGYVGLPLALQFSNASFKTIGFDIDEGKVNKISQGQTYIEHIPSYQIQEATKSNLSATCDFSMASSVDILIIAVPTPLNKYREPDMSFIHGTLNLLKPYLRKNQLISLESTTYPGTTHELIRPIIESLGFVIGSDFHLVYSPEREDPGNVNFTTRTIPKVCSGETETCLSLGVALYSSIVDKVVPVSSTAAAEMTKILENTHRAINIGLVNELKILSDRMGLDIFEIIQAAATKPFGFTPYYPGPGIGGHCIPIDPFYLTWKAREYGIHTRFIELAGEINDSMPDYVISKTTLAMNREKKTLNDSRVLVLGIAYKKNVDDMRESPSVFLMEKLRELGANVFYSDPHVPKFPKMREHTFDLESVELSEDNLRSFDCVILATAHDKFDYSLIAKNAKLIIDTRGTFPRNLPNVVRA